MFLPLRNKSLPLRILDNAMSLSLSPKLLATRSYLKRSFPFSVDGFNAIPGVFDPCPC